MSFLLCQQPVSRLFVFVVFIIHVTRTCIFLCSQTMSPVCVFLCSKAISPVCNPHLYFIVSIDHVNVCMCSCFYSPCNLYVCFLVFIAHAFLVLVGM